MVNVVSSEHIRNSSREFSIYVCSNRAIPSIADGLKDGQRKVLWVMRHKAEKVKTFSVAGIMTTEELYLHGDSSANDATSLLAAPYVNNVCFLEGTGNFGTKLRPTAYGAPRYTYVKKSKAAEKIMFSDMDIVPLKENHDGSNFSAQNFLPIIPTVLLNGISGIAVGWSTEILPHKLEDLINGCIDVLDGKKVKELVPHFSKFNISVNRIEGNSWEFKGMIDIVDSSTVRVLDLPPDLTVEKFKERLNDLEEKDVIKDYIDKSTSQINITVMFKRGALKDMTKDEIVDILKIRSRKTQRIVVLGWDNNSIKQYDTPEQVVGEFVEWRLGWYKKRYENLLANANDDKTYFEALVKCFEKKLPSKIGSLQSKKDIENEIISIIGKDVLMPEQIDKIASMPLYRWSADSYAENKNKISEIEKNIEFYENALSSEKELKKIYKNELLDLKKTKFD